jgi:hypothetical protein
MVRIKRLVKEDEIPFSGSLFHNRAGARDRCGFAGAMDIFAG